MHLNILAASCLVASPLAFAQPATIYMSARNLSTSMYSVSRSTAASNSIQTVYNTDSFNTTIGVTAYGDHAYATTLSPSQIWRGPADGGSGSILTNRGDSYARQIEFFNGSMYWNEEGSGKIFRASPDATSITEVYTGSTGYENGIWDFTIANGRFYWTSWDSPNVKSVRLDGTGFASFSLPSGIRAFSVDASDNGLVIGLSSRYLGQVWRTDFAGASPRLLASVSGDNIDQTALSVHDGRAYWGYGVGGNSYTTIVESVTLAGTDRRTELSLVNQYQIFQIDVVPAPATVALPLAATLFIPRRRRANHAEPSPVN